MHCFREKKITSRSSVSPFLWWNCDRGSVSSVPCPCPTPVDCVIWVISLSYTTLHHHRHHLSHYQNFLFPPPHQPHHIYHYTKIILLAGMINWCILFLECIIPTTLHTLELRHKLVFRFLWRPNKTRGLTPWYTIANKLPTKGIYGERAGHTWKFGRFLLQLTMS